MGMTAAAMFCFLVLLALSLLASKALMEGYYYSPVELVAGPGCSRLVRANAFFVKEITVRMVEGEQGSGESRLVVLYGLAGGAPRLDVPVAWSEARRVVVAANSHTEWVYFLNRGSEIQVDYSVKPEAANINPVCIVIVQGNERFTQWTENPSVHDTTLAWRLVHGTGTVKQAILSSGDYYVGVGNLHGQDTTVTLDIRISALLYDTTGAGYACSPGISPCTYRLPILGQNVAVLSSGLREFQRSSSGDERRPVRVVLSYEPRWIVYFVGSAIVAVVLLVVYELLGPMMGFVFCCCCTGSGGVRGRRSPGVVGQTTATASLLENKEDEESLGSSYDSVSSDGDHDAEAGGDEEEERRLCVVCCDARRDCFFLPCGHSATCHPCGTRIVEGDGGSCPFCRRKLKKVRRIFTV
ncbi:unnamed protein product [Alopecurus aequalis]